ncbi:hypothetical protein V9J34_001375 [Salmonella enterica]|nr:hypothetical protein [Salmonella enterica]EKC9954127.1 hypothetical protein [Salmonella enterica]HAK2208031.1 hypothetical protein [Salmonella enterica]
MKDNDRKTKLQILNAFYKVRNEQNITPNNLDLNKIIIEKTVEKYKCTLLENGLIRFHSFSDDELPPMYSLSQRVWRTTHSASEERVLWTWRPKTQTFEIWVGDESYEDAYGSLGKTYKNKPLSEMLNSINPAYITYPNRNGGDRIFRCVWLASHMSMFTAIIQTMVK